MKTKKISLDCISNQLSHDEMRGIMAGSGSNSSGGSSGSSLPPQVAGANWSDFDLGFTYNSSTGAYTVNGDYGDFYSIGALSSSNSTIYSNVGSTYGNAFDVAFATETSEQHDLFLLDNPQYMHYPPDAQVHVPTGAESQLLIANLLGELKVAGVSADQSNYGASIVSLMSSIASQPGVVGKYTSFITNALAGAQDIASKGASAPLVDWVEVSMGLMTASLSTEKIIKDDGVIAGGNVQAAWMEAYASYRSYEDTMNIMGSYS